MGGDHVSTLELAIGMGHVTGDISRACAD
jgi:hypothetical protein